MAQSNMYAGVAGYVGRADQVGKVGVFSRQAGAETWAHPVSEHETYAVHVHPTDPNVVFRYQGWRVSQHRQGKIVPEDELSGGAADLVVFGRSAEPETDLRGRIADLDFPQ